MGAIDNDMDKINEYKEKITKQTKVYKCTIKESGFVLLPVRKSSIESLKAARGRTNVI